MPQPSGKTKSGGKIEGASVMDIDNGILAQFIPRFQSLAKDQDRYFDALADLSEKGVIRPSQVLSLSAAGNDWLIYRYLENGEVELVCQALRKDVTSRDFHGPLFESTRRTLDQLLAMGEVRQVFAVYRAALAHRAKALAGEMRIFRDQKRSEVARQASLEWVSEYLPAFTELVDAFAELDQDGEDAKSIRDYREMITAWSCDTQR